MTYKLIYLCNFIGFKWLRLTLFKEKDPFITYDMDYISETDHVKKNFFLYGNLAIIFKLMNFT